MRSGVHVRTPCRLHFGMLSFGRTDLPQFGGVGVMVEPPAIEVEIMPAAEFAVVGSLAERARHFAELAARAWNRRALPNCKLSIRSPSDHVGLGIGTQLALSIAAGMRRFLQLPELPVAELAASIGRGTRSAVGTYGFAYGGLIVDAGHESGKPIGRLAQRIALPAAWRFVLICPTNQQGLAGASEADAFGRLPPVPDDVTQKLWRITHEEMLPALGRADCGAFGDAVYRYGRLAGECFSAVQGGPFAGAEIGQLIQSIRDYGVTGVGQSSWGPTVFALCRSEAEARAVGEWICGHTKDTRYEVTIAAPNNRGSIIE